MPVKEPWNWESFILVQSSWCLERGKSGVFPLFASMVLPETGQMSDAKIGQHPQLPDNNHLSF